MNHFHAADSFLRRRDLLF